MRAERNQNVVQGLFLLLLVISAAQVMWWIFDQVRVSSSIEQNQLDRWHIDQQTASVLLERGVKFDDLIVAYPYLEIADGRINLRPGPVAQLASDRRRHVRQYVFEGLFFLGVLVVAMALLGRILRREAELRLRQENFLAAVSHELKSPLASLRLTNETLARRTFDEEKRNELVARNLDDVGRLDRLIGNLLDTSRLEAGRVALEVSTLRLRSVVVGAVADVFGPESDSAVLLSVPAELFVEGDPVATASVVRNLLQNARDACRVAGVTAPVRVSSTVDDHSVRLEVADEGIGFEPEEAKKLFEKFYRPGDEMTRTKKGTGLGLYLVRRFMELEGGTASASSEGPGHGATFALVWPRRPSRSADDGTEQGL